jgi:hypothetical protein
MTDYTPPTEKDMDDRLAKLFNPKVDTQMFDLNALKKQLPDMPEDEVRDIIKIPAVMVFHTWDDLVSSASIPDEYKNYPFSQEDKREICNATEEALSDITAQIVEQLNVEIETFFLRKSTEEQHFGI